MLAVSSEQQAETLPHQQRMAEQTAASKGWTLDRVLGVGRDGVGSGKSGPRAIVVRLIAELTALPAAGRPAWVWMRRVDRTGRGRASESLVALHAIADLGVRIWDHDSGEVRLDTAEGEIVAGLKAGLARLENEVRASKALAGYERRRIAGKVAANLRPYGLVLGPDGKDHADEERAPIVREVYRLRLERLGRLTIARQIGAAAPPYLLRDGSTKPVVWDSKAIRRILEQRAYVPAVVDEVTWARVQAVNEQLRGVPGERREHVDKPLVGVVRCYCGAMLYWQATTAPDRSIRWPYYVCRATWNHDKHRMIRASTLEAKFEAFVKRLATKPALLDTFRRRAYKGPSPKLLERSITEGRAELAKLTKDLDAVWRLHMDGHIRREDMQGRLDSVGVERDRLAEQLDQLQRDHAVAVAASAPGPTADVLETVRIAAARWSTWRPDTKRIFARALSVHLGGFCLEADGTLAVRAISPRAARTRKVQEHF